MQLILLDDQGTTWQGESRQLREAFDSPFSGGEFVDYAIKNLGFVGINVFGKSCQIRMRPGFMTDRAAQALLTWLGKTRLERVVVSRYTDGWQSELLKPDAARAHFSDVIGPLATTPSRDFLSASLPSDILKKYGVLWDAVENWPRLMETYNTATLVELLRTVLDGRYAIVRRSTQRGKLEFQEFGRAMFPRYETWRSCAVGAPIEEQPDRSYGRWVGQIYKSSVGIQKPDVQAVDAMIRCPVNGRFRRRYTRLIFPLGTDASHELFLGGSLDDGTIDLRITAG